jgi:hypothetical protein
MCFYEGERKKIYIALEIWSYKLPFAPFPEIWEFLIGISPSHWV